MPSTTGWNGRLAEQRELLTVFAKQKRSKYIDKEHRLDTGSCSVLSRLDMKLCEKLTEKPWKKLI